MLNDVQITSCHKLVVMSLFSSQLIHRNYHISPRFEHLRHGENPRFLFHHLLDVDSDAGPGAVVEDDDEVGAHAGEYPHLQLVEEPDKEANKAGKQVNFCIKKYRSMMHGKCIKIAT